MQEVSERVSGSCQKKNVPIEKFDVVRIHLMKRKAINKETITNLVEHNKIIVEPGAVNFSLRIKRLRVDNLDFHVAGSLETFENHRDLPNNIRIRLDIKDAVEREESGAWEKCELEIEFLARIHAQRKGDT
jgi:hypothetical protein